MMAISLESVVKLVAFLIVGGYVTFVMFNGYGDIVDQLNARGISTSLLERTSGFGSFITLILLSSCAALLLPRQFHMTVVENRAIDDVKRAAWLFPALPRAHQHLRDPDRARRHADFSGRGRSTGT